MTTTIQGVQIPLTEEQIEYAESLGINHEEMSANKRVNITNHAYERYVERIVGITDRMERTRYINENKERLTDHIGKLWSFAKYIWQGQLYENITRKFWIRDNIIIITDTQVDSIITMYKIDYGWGDEMDKMLAEKVMAEIEAQRAELDAKDLAVIGIIERLQNDIEDQDMQIKKYEEILASLKAQKESNVEGLKAVRASNDVLKKEIDLNFQRICNSLEYRREIQGNNTNGGRR